MTYVDTPIPFRRVVRRSQRRRACERVGCPSPMILPGQPYHRLALPPGRLENSGDRYWMLTLHVACPQEVW